MLRLKVDYPCTIWGSDVVLPAGTIVIEVKGGGTPAFEGDRKSYAIRDVALLMRLTGNTHDPKYRYAWVPESAVEDIPI